MWLTQGWIDNADALGPLGADDGEALKAAFPAVLGFVRLLHETGITLLTGTDLMNPWMTPGVSLHRELELLNQAGISTTDVLTIATRNAAIALDALEDFGTLEVGKVADIVVLTADPLADIRNTRAIESVIKHGELFDPRVLLTDDAAALRSSASMSRRQVAWFVGLVSLATLAALALFAWRVRRH